jgi:hypothetical protein
MLLICSFCPWVAFDLYLAVYDKGSKMRGSARSVPDLGLNEVVDDFESNSSKIGSSTLNQDRPNATDHQISFYGRHKLFAIKRMRGCSFRSSVKPRPTRSRAAPQTILTGYNLNYRHSVTYDIRKQPVNAHLLLIHNYFIPGPATRGYQETRGDYWSHHHS